MQVTSSWSLFFQPDVVIYSCIRQIPRDSKCDTEYVVDIYACCNFHTQLLDSGIDMVHGLREYLPHL